MSTQRIFLIRHGEQESIGVVPDPDLSELGRKQAATLKSHLPQNIDKLIASPLQRTQQTAEIFADVRDLKIVTDKRFIEIPSPQLTLAQRMNWLREKFKSDWSKAEKYLYQWREQIMDALSEIDTDAIVITHFMVINAVVGEITKDPRFVIRSFRHCSITELNKNNGKFSVVSLGKEM